MPTYDYACTACANAFEAFHAMNAPEPPCPRCGGRVRRLILAAPAMHGEAARGRERAVRSLPRCGKGCSCCPPRPKSAATGA